MKKILTLFFFIFILSSCWNSEKSISFSEASGICYMENQDIFYVVSDEWEIQKINSNLKKLEYFQFDKKYDFEAIICDEWNNLLLTINEETWKIYKIDLKNNFKIINKYKIKWYKVEKKWIEWFTKVWKNKYIISTQTKEENLLILDFTDNEFKIIKKINFLYNDLSWLSFYNGLLYIISDKNDKIFVYNLENNKIIKSIDLKKWDWEGISFDKKWNLFLTDDKWRIVKLNME